MGMRYLPSGSATWQMYIYDKNLQGDIVGVYNTSGTKLVSYTYDAWGNCAVSYVNGGGFTAAANNPFRYRGYYYDAEIGLYYLQSRYYDANVGRFINGDSEKALIVADNILVNNLYAYCLNSPPTCCDINGNISKIIWDLLKKFILGFLGGWTGVAISDFAYNVAEGKEFYTRRSGWNVYISEAIRYGLYSTIGSSIAKKLIAAIGATLINHIYLFIFDRKNFSWSNVIKGILISIIAVVLIEIVLKKSLPNGIKKLIKKFSKDKKMQNKIVAAIFDAIKKVFANFMEIWKNKFYSSVSISSLKNMFMHG